MQNIVLLNEKAAKIKIESYSEMQESTFKSVYESAAKSVADIIREEKKTSDGIDDYNHVIAFTGDRGAGKTSAMASFSKALSEHDFKEEDFFNIVKTNGNNCVYYKCLDMIEPTKFSENESILEIVIANMYQSIENELLRAENDVRKRMLKKFADVFKSLRVLYRSKEELFDNGSLEMLGLLAKSRVIKTQFEELIDMYLNFLRSDDRCDKYLVISIDDLDMNAKHCYKISEEIRKYFCCEKLIVLMAIRIQQFTQVVQQEFISENKVLITNGSFDDNTYDMAAKYVAKLIPLYRRHNLPELGVIGIQNVTVNNTKTSLVDYFLRLIYQKTGVMLLKNNIDSHEIIPVNLREIQYLNTLLESMDNVDLYADFSEDKKEKLEHNLEVFKSYIINNYISTGMPSDYIKILNELMLQDSLSMNKFVICSLVSVDGEINNIGIPAVVKSSEIVSPSQLFNRERTGELASDFSIGDVLYVLRVIATNKVSYATRKLIAGIKIIYSLRILNHWFLNYEFSICRYIMGDSLYNPQDIEPLPSYNIKTDVKIDIFNKYRNDFLINLFIYHFAKEDATAFKYVPKYRFAPTWGAVKNFSFNAFCFITNLLDVSLLKERNGKIIYDGVENIAILPIWSIDFIDKFFFSFRRTFDLVGKNKKFKNKPSNYIECSIEAINRNFKDIINAFNPALTEKMMTYFRFLIQLYNGTEDVENYKPKAELGDFVNNIFDYGDSFEKKLESTEKTSEQLNIETKVKDYAYYLDKICISSRNVNLLFQNDFFIKGYKSFYKNLKGTRYYYQNLTAPKSILEKLEQIVRLDIDDKHLIPQFIEELKNG